LAAAQNERVEFGAHLPLLDFGTSPSLRGLKEYARAAAELGFRYLTANDHLLYSRPWLDGPTALAAVIEDSGDLKLATTVSLPVLRGPVQLAKALTAIDVLSGGRVVAGLGPGSSPADYEAVGIPFDERFTRFDEALTRIRALLEGDELQPRPQQQPRPPIWVAGWGGRSGLRLVAKHGDGWLASMYNTTPERFGRNLQLVLDDVRAAGRDAGSFANALATGWMYITESANEADRILADVLGPTVKRPVEELRELSLPIGPAEVCAERLAAFARAGAERLFVWPLADPVKQLELFREWVVPLV
jgi:alkanesulfonate monooxygenase SsuD/methylene tetrahydromethanopterin reductase-like flavin-dependent oxidoreductase (luciferase family)